jgi:hypothetical protein
MPKYLIERKIPGAANLTERDLIAISKKSRRVLERMGPGIQWVHSYVTADSIHCVYIAPNEEMIREHGKQGEFPVTKISVVATIIDPTTAEK